MFFSNKILFFQKKISFVQNFFFYVEFCHFRFSAQLKKNLTMLTSVDSALTKWLTRNGYWRPKSDADTPYTHLSLDGTRGGVVCLPATRETEFLELLAKDIADQKHIFFAEARTPFFKFFIDLDLKLHDKLTDRQLDALMFCILDTVKLFFPQNTKPGRFEMLLCDTSEWEKREHKRKKQNKDLDMSSEDDVHEEKEAAPKSFIKEGLHLFFPEITVRVEEAVTMGRAIASKTSKPIRHNHAGGG